MVLNKIKQKLEELKTGFVTQVDKSFTREQIEMSQINEDLDHDRQMAKAKAKDEERKRKMLEESMGGNREDGQDKKTMVANHLSDRKEQMQQQNLENHISLRQFFQELEQGNLEVGLANQARNRTFGTLDDIVLDDRGMMFLINKQGDIVMGGPNWGDIVQSPSGMIADMQAGILPLNLSDEGRHLPSSETAQVPQVVWTNEEGIVFSDQHTEKYKTQLAQMQQQIQTLSQQLKEKEVAMVGMNQAIKERDRQLERMETIAEAEQEAREKTKEMSENAIRQYNQMEIELNKTDAVKDFWEEISQAVLRAQSESVDEIIDEMKTSDFERTEDQIRRSIQMFVNEAPKLENMMNQSGGEQSAEPASQESEGF